MSTFKRQPHLLAPSAALLLTAAAADGGSAARAEPPTQAKPEPTAPASTQEERSTPAHKTSGAVHSAQSRRAEGRDPKTSAPPPPGSSNGSKRSPGPPAPATTATPRALDAAAAPGAAPAKRSDAASAVPAGKPAVGRGTGVVEVELPGLETDKGQILAAVFLRADGFPDKVKKSFANKAVKIGKNRRVLLVFEGVPAGPFAVAVHHDENADFKMQTGLFGIPSEGYGTSRDAEPNFGPPSFEDARLVVAPGEKKRIVIHMRY